jgi:hypothetical protein
MNADDLRQTARDIREKANAATPGPWIQDEWSVIEEGYESEVAHLDGHFRVADKNGPHIAAWHPDVALAAADWLDAVAKRADEIGSTLPANIRHDVITHNTTGYTEALAFVEAWRGGAS